MNSCKVNGKKREVNSMERKCQCLELEKKYIDLESETKKVKEELRKVRESEENWKRKFEKLVRTVQKLDEMSAFRYGEGELDESLELGLELARTKFLIGKKTEDDLSREGLAYHQSSGSPYITTPAKENITGRHRDKMSCGRKFNKMLVFEGDDDKSTDVVDLSDCETEEKSIGENYEDEDVEACEVNISSPLPARKRKLVITSDSDNDNDDEEDNIPISVLKKLKPSNQEMPDLSKQHRVSSRLSKQRVPEEISTSSKQRLVGIPTTGNAEDDDETEEEGSESESESLDGFIVDDETVSEKSDEIEEEESDGETGYADVISRLRRDKKPKKQKWEYEADMLADFGKDPELCMRAVCVLYRFQTEDEKVTSSSHVSNGRGFNKFDAVRGTRIGKFLTDGDPVGDLKKSVEELKSFEFDAVEICRSLADRYSKQLFQIYNNREDPFFTLPPSP